MAGMTSHERFSRMYQHREADRVPIIDEIWNTTLARWRSEGMPADVTAEQYFGLDKEVTIGVDNTPRLGERVVEETDEFIIATTNWGATRRQFKHRSTTPELLDVTVKTADDWRRIKDRMTPSRDRVDWAQMKANWSRWRAEGYWIQASILFGFDITHARMVGTERLLMAMVEDPQWVVEMFDRQLDVGLALLEMVWEEGYHFDTLRWWDDMGYKLHQFFSIPMYRELLKPFHKRAVDWAHSKGIYAHLHSCGDIRPFVPELVEIGLDALNPMEVKAGVDPLELKKTWGYKLVLHGGINAVYWDQPAKITAEMQRVIPTIKAGGGYIFSSDHSVPDTVSLKDFTHIIEMAKKLGSYE